MNVVQAALRKEIEQEVALRGGFSSYRKHVLGHLQLKTVVRESHSTPVIQLAFNHVGICNLVATVGGDQATVYDDVHVGDHVGIVVHFTNSKTDHHKGGALRALAWVSCHGLTYHPGDDAWLAVSGCDHVIQVISVAQSRVIFQLAGHTCDVVDLCGAKHIQGLLLSMSQDGCVRLWDVPAATCLACIPTDAHTVELHPCGTYFLSGNKYGHVHRWDISSILLGSAYPNKAEQTTQVAPEHQLVFVLEASPGETQQVDCIKFLGDDLVAVKSSGGIIGVWRLLGDQAASCERVWSVAVPDAVTSGSYPSRCVINASADGAYICCGNISGCVYVYDSLTGAHMCTASADKVEAPVRACGLSHDCRHLWAVLGNGFIFRFEYVMPEQANTSSEDKTDLADQETKVKVEDGARKLEVAEVVDTDVDLVPPAEDSCTTEDL